MQADGRDSRRGAAGRDGGEAQERATTVPGLCPRNAKAPNQCGHGSGQAFRSGERRGLPRREHLKQ